jgi:hypothetical protein
MSTINIHGTAASVLALSFVLVLTPTSACSSTAASGSVDAGPGDASAAGLGDSGTTGPGDSSATGPGDSGGGDGAAPDGGSSEGGTGVLFATSCGAPIGPSTEPGVGPYHDLTLSGSGFPPEATVYYVLVVDGSKTPTEAPTERFADATGVLSEGTRSKRLEEGVDYHFFYFIDANKDGRCQPTEEVYSTVCLPAGEDIGQVTSTSPDAVTVSLKYGAGAASMDQRAAFCTYINTKLDS